ncbi:MAG: cytochrome [Propionibacteriaceae bacterium]|jgi:cytochrome P450|nr:cytochrome [Propionibacteriaceae bacterium]
MAESQPLDTAGSAAKSNCPTRKLSAAGDALFPGVERRADEPEQRSREARWTVRSFDVARAVLRNSEAVRQAGFGADTVNRAGSSMRPPILYLEGSAHRTQRSAAARLFAPKVTEDYRDMMERLSDELVGTLRTDRWVDLSRLSLRMAVQVAARVVGLTDSSLAGMSRRLDSFFDSGPSEISRNPISVLRFLRGRSTLLRFYYLDVKPAIRARRRRRRWIRRAPRLGRDDVISQLLDAGFSDLDILTECVTYGAAGMATTREFITVAVWHLLDDPDLIERYRRASTAERIVILNEILRLEPVVGHLYRRTTGPVTLATPEGPVELPLGSLIDLDLRAVNADQSIVGGCPMSLLPGRELPPTVPPTLMSFGDGHHRCPGGPLAIMETEVFVSALLRYDLIAEGPPIVQWNPVTQGYNLDRFRIRRRS